MSLNTLALLTTPQLAKDLQDILNNLITNINNGFAALSSPGFTLGGAAAGNVYNPSGVAYATGVSTGTAANTTETTLASYTLPANALNANGKGVRIKAWGTCGATANNKTMKLYFGAAVITTPVAATNAKNWFLDMLVIKNGDDTQSIIGQGVVDVTPVTPYFNAGAIDDGAGILIKMTGTNGTAAANDIVCKGMIVEFLN